MRILIDTASLDYQGAVALLQAAYGVDGMSADEVVWTPRNAVGGAGDVVWTELMLRDWVRDTVSLDVLNLVWRVCACAGEPVPNPKLTAYIAPGESEIRARTRMSAAVRDARKSPSGARRAMPMLKDTRRGRTSYLADPAVAVILMDEIAKSPLYERMHHHEHPMDIEGTCL